MKLKIASLVAVLMMTSAAYAAWDAAAVTQQYLDQGYTNVEMRVGATRATLEAIKDGTKIEVTFDIATGEIVKQESHAVSAADTKGGNLDVRDLKNGSSGDDDGSDDVNDDHGGDDDTVSDDHGGDDSGHNSSDDAGDDSGDDHGGGDDD